MATKDCLLKTDMLKTINKNSQSSQKTSAVSRQKKVRLLRGRVISDKMDNKIYFQVTLSLANEEVKKREFGNLLAIKNNYRKIVITADEYKVDSIEGIETMNIRDFLMNFE